MTGFRMRVAEQYVDVDFDLAVSMGLIDGFSHIHKFGLNTAVGSAFETVWSMNAAYVYLAAATVLNVSSGDVDDTAAGAGAQQIVVQGLDGNFNEISEYVELNGQTAVATKKAYFRVHRMMVTRGASNQGIVYIGTGGPASGVPTTTYGAIPLGYGQTLQCFYTVPAGKTLYMYEFKASSGVSKNITVRICVRPQGAAFQTKDVMQIVEGQGVNNWKFPFKIPAGCDIEVQALAGAGGGSIEATFTGLVVNQHSSRQF